MQVNIFLVDRSHALAAMEPECWDGEVVLVKWPAKCRKLQGKLLLTATRTGRLSQRLSRTSSFLLVHFFGPDAPGWFTFPIHLTHRLVP